MANTIMSAKNSFQDGLLLDFSPENSKATSMTAALNATLVTFNGNEMSLQNDMGNGRVETAFLPEGYVPVGSCEFGDIIYIVSYNPLINKSQIGCFPSPERNISSEELGGLQQSLSWKDFQEGDTTPNGELKASSVKKILYDNRDMTPGDKYIIYSSDLKQTSNNQYLSDYGNKIHEHGEFPKLAKIHVVSIEESGKIVYLDSTTKWYDNNYYLNADLEVNGGLKDIDSYRTMVSSAYSVFSSKVSGKLALLVELEKITGFSCSWEPYVSATTNTHTTYDIYWNFNWTTNNNNINPDGAILVTSEWTGVDKNKEGQYQEWVVNDSKIELSSTSWKDINQLPIPYNNGGYQSWNFSRYYKPENNISFDSFISTYSYDKYLEETIKDLTTGNLSIPYKLSICRNESIPQEGSYYVNCTNVIDSKYYTQDINGAVREITATSLKDDFVNNYFHYPIVKKFASFNIPTKQILNVNGETIEKTPNISNLIYHYEVAPTMPYGILREFTQEGYIDFSKIGTKSIALNTWKYYNYENTSTLTWGMEAYTEPGKGISEVVFEFYDNQGFVAAYHTKGKNSYNGVFTEYITLSESGSNYKLNNVDHKGVVHTHKGLEVAENDRVQGINYIKEGNKYYQDDSGTLYPNLLYLVKIIIKYCNKGVLDEYIETDDSYIEDYRWFWTNTMFNEYYYQVNDFKELQFTLGLDGNIVYSTTNNWKVEKSTYEGSASGSVNIGDEYKTLSATVQHINQDGSKDGNIKMGVQGGLVNSYNCFNLLKKTIGKINTKFYYGLEYLENSPEQPNIIFSEQQSSVFNGVYPVNSDKYAGKVSGNTSDILNKLVNSPTQGTGEDLWGSEDSYKQYVNDFHLEPDNKDYTSIGNLESGKLEYIKKDGSSSGELSDFKTYTTTLDKVLYDDRYLNLTFSGIHYSKYYYTTKKEAKSGILRPFVLTDSDLSEYKIEYNNTTKEFYYNKAVMFAIGNEGGDNTWIRGCLGTFSNSNNCTEATPIIGTNADGNDKDDGGGDKDIPATLFLSVNSDLLLETFKFLFPMVVAHRGGWGTKFREAHKGNTPVSENVEIKTGNYTDYQLGGTLIGIASDSTMEPGDHFLGKTASGDKNALTRFIPYVMGYLTQFYYLTSGEFEIDVPGNFVYLDKNSITYSRDIVLEMKTDSSSNNNDLILFLGFKPFSVYLQEVLDNCPGTNHEQKSNNALNVKLKLEGCLKTCPISFKFDYIPPTLQYISSNYTQVQSCFSEIPKMVSQGFQPDTIYGWDFSSKSFKHARECYNMNISNYTLSGISIVGTTTNNNVYVNKQSSQLAIDQGKYLTFRNIPVTYNGSNTYTIRTHKDFAMNNFKTGLKYYG